MSLANSGRKTKDPLQEQPGRSASVVKSVAPNANSNTPTAHVESPFWRAGALGPSPPQGAEPVGEDESQLQICREMSQWQSMNSHPAPISPTSPRKGHEVIEFHGGINSVTILSEVLGRAPLKRLVRIVLRDPQSGPRHRLELSGLDEADIEYLERKGAFTIPPADIWYTQAPSPSLKWTNDLGDSDQFLRLYFQCVYIYAPVIDRLQFVLEYRNQTASTFLLQSILASVAPYAPTNLIHDAGFEDYTSAQKTFIDRARLLYDIGAEKNQLRQLQGATILSHLYVSLYTEKDYRYWLSNATRIATKMGLHKDEMGQNVDPPLRRLLRRLWWVLCNRDALLVFNGLDNLRRIHETDFDTSALTLDDWDEEEIPTELKDILPPITRLQKSFLVASCKLSLTSKLPPPRVHPTTIASCL